MFKRVALLVARARVVAKGQTPEQKFKHLFDLSFDKSTTQGERDTAQRKWREWLKRRNKTSNDISLILAKAVKDDDDANPHPPPDPRDRGAASPGAHPFDDADHNPATMIESFARQYLAMREHALVVFVLSIAATHVYEKFSIAPRVLFTSEDPDSGKSTALEIARSLVYRANEESFATAAAIRDHLGRTLAADSASCSVALDEGDLLDAKARAALLLLWNLGHAKGAKHSLMAGGHKKLTNLFAPMFAAGFGASSARRSSAGRLFSACAPMTRRPSRSLTGGGGEDGDTAGSRKETIDTLYRYLRHWAETRKFRLQPRMPAEIIRRAADNFRSLLSVTDVCGGDWPRRAREALVALVKRRPTTSPRRSSFDTGGCCSSGSKPTNSRSACSTASCASSANRNSIGTDIAVRPETGANTRSAFPSRVACCAPESPIADEMVDSAVAAQARGLQARSPAQRIRGGWQDGDGGDRPGVSAQAPRRVAGPAAPACISHSSVTT